MADGGNGFLLGVLTVGAGEYLQAVFLTGRLVNDRLAPIVADGRQHILTAFLTVGAGEYLQAVLLTGRLLNGGLAPIVADGEDQLISLLSADRAGVALQSESLTGSLFDDFCAPFVSLCGDGLVVACLTGNAGMAKDTGGITGCFLDGFCLPGMTEGSGPLKDLLTTQAYHVSFLGTGSIYDPSLLRMSVMEAALGGGQSDHRVIGEVGGFKYGVAVFIGGGNGADLICLHEPHQNIFGIFTGL